MLQKLDLALSWVNLYRVSFLWRGSSYMWTHPKKIPFLRYDNFTVIWERVLISKLANALVYSITNVYPHLWLLVILFTVMFLLLVFGAYGENNFFNVSSCTDIKLEDLSVEVFEKCQGPGLVIHCLPDNHDNLGLCCFPITWIEKGNYFFIRTWNIMPLE